MELQNTQVESKDKIKKKMVSFLIPEPILDTITDIENYEERSRSAILMRLVKRGLKSYDYESVV
jgi:hypothetical protein